MTLSLTEPENPYNFIEIRGEVTEYIEGEEADAQINWLAQKYVGEETYPWRKPGELRVKMLVKPTYVYHLIR